MATSIHTKRNFAAFIWHALFLAFVSSFIDVNTVLSSFILYIGGSSIHVGILSAFFIGLPLITQFFFAGFLSGRQKKKPFLLAGIYLRVFALLGMGSTICFAAGSHFQLMLVMIFFWVGIFAVSGAFAGISYTDIIGKTFIGYQRKRFLIFKQFIMAAGMLVSALLVRQLVLIFPYPRNYMILFIAAAGLLFTAALGFLVIREKTAPAAEGQGMLAMLKIMPRMLKIDRNLRNYVLLLNFSSLGLTSIPFYVALPNALFGLERNQVGNFLVLQFVGMILSTVFWNRIAKSFQFKGIAYGFILIASLLPLSALFLVRQGIGVYQWIFLGAGVSIAAYKIFIDGILLEISTDTNRALYAGISGALSLSSALFPFLTGICIAVWGFTPIFVIMTPVLLCSVLFLSRIRCGNQAVI